MRNVYLLCLLPLLLHTTMAVLDWDTLASEDSDFMVVETEESDSDEDDSDSDFKTADPASSEVQPLDDAPKPRARRQANFVISLNGVGGQNTGMGTGGSAWGWEDYGGGQVGYPYYGGGQVGYPNYGGGWPGYAPSYTYPINNGAWQGNGYNQGGSQVYVLNQNTNGYNAYNGYYGGSSYPYPYPYPYPYSYPYQYPFQVVGAIPVNIGQPRPPCTSSKEKKGKCRNSK